MDTFICIVLDKKNRKGFVSQKMFLSEILNKFFETSTSFHVLYDHEVQNIGIGEHYYFSSHTCPR
jgi:hypothetical protein